MIPIEKGDEPAVLRENCETWTEELVEYLEADQNPPEHVRRRYAHPDVKEAVRRECRGKCIYCESKISHVAPGDIEHIKPKGNYPKETFEWENLAFVCNECNRRKSDRYDEDKPPLNPYKEDPRTRLKGAGAYVFPMLADSRAELTVGLVELNRVALLERRGERIERIRSLAERHAQEENDLHKEILLEELCREATAEREFSFVVSELLRLFEIEC